MNMLISNLKYQGSITPNGYLNNIYLYNAASSTYTVLFLFNNNI